MGGHFTYSSHSELIQRILISATALPSIFWEVWAFMPEQDIFYIFQKNHYQKCTFKDNSDYLKEDPHFTIMSQPLSSRVPPWSTLRSQPLSSRIIPWSTLPPRYAPRGINGLSLFLSHTSGYLGYAKIGMEGPMGGSAPLGDDEFLEMIARYKKDLEQDLEALRALHYEEEMNS